MHGTAMGTAHEFDKESRLFGRTDRTVFVGLAYAEGNEAECLLAAGRAKRMREQG
jgi:hypothetical protein